MPKITFQPSGKTIKARLGQSLLHAAGAARVSITQRCGGKAACLMCKVIVKEGVLSIPTEQERLKIGDKELAAGTRLSCQAKVQHTDCVVLIPEDRLKSAVAAALAKQKLDEDF